MIKDAFEADLLPLKAAVFAVFPRCLQQPFNIYVSSAANLVHVERVLSEKLRIWLCLFFLLVKMADMEHIKTSIVFLIIKPKIF